MLEGIYNDLTCYCNCETLAVLRFRYLVHHFSKPCDYDDIPSAKYDAATQCFDND